VASTSRRWPRANGRLRPNRDQLRCAKRSQESGERVKETREGRDRASEAVAEHGLDGTVAVARRGEGKIEPYRGKRGEGDTRSEEGRMGRSLVHGQLDGGGPPVPEQGGDGGGARWRAVFRCGFHRREEEREQARRKWKGDQVPGRF
jgi:hypothetical protein